MKLQIEVNSPPEPGPETKIIISCRMQMHMFFLSCMAQSLRDQRPHAVCGVVYECTSTKTMPVPELLHEAQRKKARDFCLESGVRVTQ